MNRKLRDTNAIRTASPVATMASEQLKNKTSKKAEKSVAGSALVNRKKKTK